MNRSWQGTLQVPVVVAAALVAAGLVACSGSSPAVCQKGDTRTCVGPGQCAGGQVCLEDGSGFGACDCGTGGGSGGGTGGGSGGGTGGGSGGGTGGGTGGSADGGDVDGGDVDGGDVDGGDVDGGLDGGPPPRGTADFTLLNFSALRGSVDPVRRTYSWSGSLPDGGVLDGGATAYAEFGGLAGLNGWLGALRASSPNPLVVTSGDLLHGSQQLNVLFDDAPVLEGARWLGLRYATFGEQELLQGVATLRSRISDGGITWVTSNLTNTAAELPQAVSGYALAEVGSGSPPVRVAFLGVARSDLETRAGAGTLGAMTVADPVTATQAAARAARDAGADVVVALAHVGPMHLDDAGVAQGPLAAWAQAVAGDVDVVVGDFGDNALAQTVGGALVVQGRSRGFTVQKVSVSVVNGLVTSRSAALYETNLTPHPSDGGAEALLLPFRSLLTSKLDQPLATTPTRFARNQVHERLGEVNMGNLVTDAMLARYRVSHGAQLALLNGGGLRAPLPSFYNPVSGGLVRTGCSGAAPCDLVTGDAYTVLPFGNACVVRTISGQQLWEALEHGLAQLPAIAGRMVQVSGVRFTYDLSRAPGDKVTAVTLCRGGHGTTDAGVVGGECLDPVAVPKDSAPYVLVTDEFLSAGGDGYVFLAQTEQQSLLLHSTAEALEDFLRVSSSVDLPCPGITTACGLSASSPAQVCGSAAMDTPTLGTTCRGVRTQ